MTHEGLSVEKITQMIFSIIPARYGSSGEAVEDRAQARLVAINILALHAVEIEPLRKKVNLYEHMRDVAEANGFESLTDAIAQALQLREQSRRLADALHNAATELNSLGSIMAAHYEKQAVEAWSRSTISTLNQAGV